MKCKRYYRRLAEFLTKLIEREGVARQDKDANGVGKHYTVKAQSFKRLEKLAKDALYIDGIDIDDKEMLIATFASIITQDDAARWLRSLPNRDTRNGGGLWSSSVGAFINSDAVVREKMDAFCAARWQGTTGDDTNDTPAPYWSYFIRFIFRYSEWCINKANEHGEDAVAHVARKEALCRLFDVVATCQLTLKTLYSDNSAQANLILLRFFDRLRAADDDGETRSDVLQVSRHKRLSYFDYIGSKVYVDSIHNSDVRELYNAFRNGLTEDGRQYPHIEIVE